MPHCLFFAIVFALPLLAQDVPTPKQFFGFEPGEDRRLLSWPELFSYYETLGRTSPYATTTSIGTSTEGRQIAAVIISSRPKEEWSALRERQGRLARGRLAPEETLEALSSHPNVVYLQGQLHSTEVGASLLFPHLLYRLVTGEDATTREIRQNLIVVAVPSANPDGTDLVAEWYSKTLDTPWEGSSPPRLYQKYAGHDNNRDWFMLSLKETQVVSKLLYREWYPTIVLDIHQMGGSGARMFVPPFSDPINPNLPATLSRMIDLCGHHMALKLTMNGCTGVVQDVTFDNYWSGGARNTPVRHNMVGLLTETASARLASPTFLSVTDLKGHGAGFPEVARQGNYPDPWPGGWWRMNDVVRYQWISTFALLEFASRFRETFVANFHDLARTSIRQGASEGPRAFILPSTSRDTAATHRLLRNLFDTGVEVHRSKTAIIADGATFAPGSYVVSCAQAFRPHLKDLLEYQEYPALKVVAGGDIVRPYDASAWSLPLLFDVPCTPVKAALPPDAELELLSEIGHPASTFSVERAEKASLAVRASNNGAYAVLNKVLKENVPVRQSATHFHFPGDARDLLEKAAEGLGLEFTKTDERAVPFRDLKPVRTAIFLPAPASMDGGWTRLVLEEHGFSPVELTASEIKSGRLRERFESIVLPDIDAKRLRDGAGPGDLPPEFQGGLGVEGGQALRMFVKEGGQLLAFASALPYVIDLLELPWEVSPAASEEPEKRVICPGSLLRARPEHSMAGSVPEPSLELASLLTLDVDPANGLPIYVDSGRALKLKPHASASRTTSVLRYPERDLLVAGHLERGERLAGLSPLVIADFGEGRAILFAFRPQHRSQTLGTFRLVFAALHGRGLLSGPALERAPR